LGQTEKHSDVGDSFYEASASSAVMAAQRLKAKCIIVHTETGTPSQGFSGEVEGRRERWPLRIQKG
jgi:hypothetical protein